MDDKRIAYLVNSTPKYFYMLPLHFALIRRYAPNLVWDLFFATEVPDHPVCNRIATEFGVKILPIPEASAGFLESRHAALEELAPHYRYVLMAQEDFLLDRAPMATPIAEIVRAMDVNPSLVSARLTPCPGPGGEPVQRDWAALQPATDSYLFVLQATLWRTSAAQLWYQTICYELERIAPIATTPPARRIQVEIRENISENATGQKLFHELTLTQDWQHWAWIRAGPWPNAVYLCPWPYRPTAIVKGRLEPWAAELGKREGYPLVP